MRITSIPEVGSESRAVHGTADSTSLVTIANISGAGFLNCVVFYQATYLTASSHNLQIEIDDTVIVPDQLVHGLGVDHPAISTTFMPCYRFNTTMVVKAKKSVAGGMFARVTVLYTLD